MSGWMVLKIAGDVFFYFSVIGAFPFLFPCEMSFFWPGVLCGAGAGFAAFLDGQGRRELRFLSLTVPLCAFILTSVQADRLVLAPVVVYTAAVILRGDFSLDYYSFRQFFKQALKIWAVFYLIILLAHTFELEVQSTDILLDSNAPLRCGLLWAACSVMLQRQLRLGEPHYKRTPKESAALALGSGTVLLGFVGLERLLMAYSTSINEILSKTIQYLVGIPIGLIGGVIQKLMQSDRLLMDWLEQESTSAATEPAYSGTIPMGTPVEPEKMEQAAESGFPWWLVVIVIVVLAVVLVYMFRILRKGKRERGSGPVIQKVQVPKKEKREGVRTNRGKVRKVYRTYLKAQRKSGAKLRTNQTSLDILNQHVGNTDIKAAAQLRRIYLAARYDESRAVTSEQVKAAQNIIKEL